MFKRYDADKNITTENSYIRNFQQGTLSASKYGQQHWTKKLNCGSVYAENVLKGIFIEGLRRSICCALQQ